MKDECSILDQIHQFKINKNIWISKLLNDPCQFMRRHHHQNSYIYTLYKVQFNQRKITVTEILKFEEKEKTGCWLITKKFLVSYSGYPSWFYVRNKLNGRSNVFENPEEIRPDCQDVKHVSFIY